MLNKYLLFLQEEEKLGFWGTIGKWLEFKQSKHPKYKVIADRYNKDVRDCRSHYPPKRDININIKTPGQEVPIFSYTDYEENPKFVICKMEAALKFWESFFKWVKEVGVEDICKFNLNKERCEMWVEEMKAEGGDELEFVKKELKKGKLDKNSFKKVANKLGRFEE